MTTIIAENVRVPMTKASYEMIDYNLRPAKAIERKMLVELFRRLDRVAALRHYRYVGFGSPYFADFALFHRVLDIQSMISIEREIDDRPRFEFNRPFAAVDLRFGESAEVLPSLDWQQRTIIWLDYDDALDTAMLNDIALCADKLTSGSILIVSARAQLNFDRETRLEELRENLEDFVPPELTIDDLGGWDVAHLYQRIIDERIKVAIRERNAGRPASVQVTYEQLVNFQYADGVKMMTVGGVIVDKSDEGHFFGCDFGELEFHRAGSEAYRICLPRLTPKEIRHLDALLPSGTPPDATDVGIPLAQSNKYAGVYRYFPKYVDIEG